MRTGDEGGFPHASPPVRRHSKKGHVCIRVSILQKRPLSIFHVLNRTPTNPIANMKEGFNDDGGESGIFSLSIGKEEMV